MSSFSETKKMIRLRSSEGKIFEVEEEVARVSKTIEGMIEEGIAESVIPIMGVSGEILAMVLDYCKEHRASNDRARSVDEENSAGKSKKEMEEWEKGFMAAVDTTTLYHLLLASNFLNVSGLLNLAVEKTAEMIRGKYPHEIRKMFNIVNDFTPEEEHKIRSANPWAFEDDPKQEEQAE